LGGDREGAFLVRIPAMTPPLPSNCKSGSEKKRSGNNCPIPFLPNIPLTVPTPLCPQVSLQLWTPFSKRVTNPPKWTSLPLFFILLRIHLTLGLRFDEGPSASSTDTSHGPRVPPALRINKNLCPVLVSPAPTHIPSPPVPDLQDERRGVQSKECG
jgi:hypothetical protein